jgi:hypothetical protein
MSENAAVWALLVIAFVAANLPWLSERFLLVVTPKEGKRVWMRLLEWLVLYFVVGGIALGIEIKYYGEAHAQNWEFYVITFCLFAVLALPGFLYRHVLRKLLDRRM